MTSHTDSKFRKPADQRSSSAVLRHFLETVTSERISIGDLRSALGDRAYGVLMLLFAIPNLFPISIPGLSAILGIPIMLLSTQLLFGQQQPWFPRFLANRSFARNDFATVISRAIPVLEKVERVLKPRLLFLSSWLGERFLAFACLLFSTVLSLPIPFGNLLPALAICILCLALIEKDGIAYLAGMIVGIVSVIIASSVVVAIALAAVYAIQKYLAL